MSHANDYENSQAFAQGRADAALTAEDFMPLAKRKALAQGFRDLAKRFEEGDMPSTGFTCLAVKYEVSLEAGAAYAQVFEMHECYDTANAVDLWSSENTRDLRVLMLCFAAAMAETGDLT